MGEGIEKLSKMEREQLSDQRRRPEPESAMHGGIYVSRH